MPRIDRSFAVRPIFSDTLLALVLTVFYLRNSITDLGFTLNNLGDPMGQVWLMDWLTHCFVGDGKLANVFNTNMFFPSKNTLTWSDSMIGFLPLHLPAKALTGSTIFAINFTGVVLVFVGCAGMIQLARDALQDRRTLSAAWVAPLIGATGLVVASQEGHIQFRAHGLLVWIFVVGLRGIREPTPRRVAFVACATLWMFLASIYYAVMLAVIVFIGLVVAPLFDWRGFGRWLRQAFRATVTPTCLVPTIALAIPVGYVAKQYMVAEQTVGKWGKEQFDAYSARLGSFLDVNMSLIYPAHSSHYGAGEARLFFGVAVTLLALLAVIPWRERGAMTKMATQVAGVVVLASLILAFGPESMDAKLSGDTRITLPASWFIDYFPGFSSMRCLGRFGLFAAPWVGVLAAIGLTRLAKLTGSARAAVIMIGVLGIAVEQTTVVPTAKVHPLLRAHMYAAIAKLVPPDAPLLQLPVDKGSPDNNVYYFTEQMGGSTLHFRPLFVGYSSKGSSYPEHFSAPLAEFNNNTIDGPALRKRFADWGARYILVDPGEISTEEARRLANGFDAAKCQRKLAGTAWLFDCSEG